MGIGVSYGQGSLSPILPGNTWTYNDMPSVFNSNYSYEGYMSIYVTCSDNTRVGTYFFVSRSSTNPHPLPSVVVNPCCDDDRLPPASPPNPWW
jgi:hypothetical protein